MARQFKDAFAAGGGIAQFVMTPPFGRDGHQLFSAAGIPRWTPIVDDFLKRRNLALRAAPLPLPSAAIAAPPQLGARGREDFAAYLASDTKGVRGVARRRLRLAQRPPHGGGGQGRRPGELPRP